MQGAQQTLEGNAPYGAWQTFYAYATDTHTQSQRQSQEQQRSAGKGQLGSGAAPLAQGPVPPPPELGFMSTLLGDAQTGVCCAKKGVDRRGGKQPWERGVGSDH